MRILLMIAAQETVLSSGSLPATPSRVDDNAIVTESTADVLDQSMGNPEHEGTTLLRIGFCHRWHWQVLMKEC